MTSAAMPFFFRLTASSSSILSDGFMLILTLAASTPRWSPLSGILKLLTTRSEMTHSQWNTD